MKAETAVFVIIMWLAGHRSRWSREYHKTVDLKTSFTYVAFKHDHDSFSIVVCKQWIKLNELLYVWLDFKAWNDETTYAEGYKKLVNQEQTIFS